MVLAHRSRRAHLGTSRAKVIRAKDDLIENSLACRGLVAVLPQRSPSLRCGGAAYGEQPTFADEAWGRKKYVTHREQFLAEMTAVFSWATPMGVIPVDHPAVANGAAGPMPLARLLRI
jgi:hypothetical protein